MHISAYASRELLAVFDVDFSDESSSTRKSVSQSGVDQCSMPELCSFRHLAELSVVSVKPTIFSNIFNIFDWNFETAFKVSTIGKSNTRLKFDFNTWNIDTGFKGSLSIMIAFTFHLFLHYFLVLEPLGNIEGLISVPISGKIREYWKKVVDKKIKLISSSDILRVWN